MDESPTSLGIIERLSSRAQSAVSQLRVRSALNPMLWLCGIISIPSAMLAIFAGGAEPVTTILMCLAVAPVAATIVGFLYFAVFKPEKLQSEEYQIRRQTLELIKEKGSNIAISPASLEAIATPITPSLPRGQS